MKNNEILLESNMHNDLLDYTSGKVTLNGNKQQDVENAPTEEPLVKSLWKQYVLQKTRYNNNDALNKNKTSTETVKVHFIFPHEKCTKTYFMNKHIYEIKKDVELSSSLPADKIKLFTENNEILDNWTSLAELHHNKIVVLKVTYDYLNETEIKSTMSPVETVRQVVVQDAVGSNKVFLLNVQDVCVSKKWLGGFRDKRTNKIYHNAQTETNYWARTLANPHVDKFKRNAQTHLHYVSAQVQATSNKITQVPQSGIFLDTSGDVYLQPKPYRRYNHLSVSKRKENAAITIQRWFRKYLSWNKVKNDFSKLIEIIKNKRLKTAEDELQFDLTNNLIGMVLPTERDDFFRLHTLIALWWRSEYNKISQINNLEQKKAELYNLLLNEIDILYYLETQKIKSKCEASKKKDVRTLEETSLPLVKKYPDKVNLIDTLEAQRSREMKEAYALFTSNHLTKSERIELLMRIKTMVSNFEDFDRAQELVTLLDREIDLLSMGLGKEHLIGLRKRIEEVLMLHLRSKKCNSNMKSLHATKCNILRNRFYRCVSCHKLRDPSQFGVHVRMTTYRQCDTCNWRFTTSHSTLNLAPYMSILKLLRAREVDRCGVLMYCFLLQPMGTFYIVNTIWNGRSAISESAFLPELRLVRWHQNQEWTPWNCILLTEDEAKIHEKIENNQDVYASDFIQSVKLKHINAKITFKLAKYSNRFLNNAGVWKVDRDLYGMYPNRTKKFMSFENPIFN